MDDPQQRYRVLSAESLAEGDPTGWFDRLYTEASAGRARVPWDRHGPHPLLAARLERLGRGAGGARALVVGCGPGDDAETVAAHGFDTVAFDVSAAAIRAAHERYPESTVDYRVADLFDPPQSWRYGFDLVVEVFTVQAMPVGYHEAAIDAIGRFVVPGGTLLVVSFARETDLEHADDPPWPLTRAEIDSFTGSGLVPVAVRRTEPHLWWAEYTRPHQVPGA